MADPIDPRLIGDRAAPVNRFRAARRYLARAFRPSAETGLLAAAIVPARGAEPPLFTVLFVLDPDAVGTMTATDTGKPAAAVRWSPPPPCCAAPIAVSPESGSESKLLLVSNAAKGVALQARDTAMQTSYKAIKFESERFCLREGGFTPVPTLSGHTARPAPAANARNGPAGGTTPDRQTGAFWIAAFAPETFGKAGEPTALGCAQPHTANGDALCP